MLKSIQLKVQKHQNSLLRNELSALKCINEDMAAKMVAMQFYAEKKEHEVKQLRLQLAAQEQK